MRVYLIDGYSLLYRAFYALPQSIATTSGLPTNALYGFTSMVLKLLDSEEEVGLGVVWDAGIPAFRLEVFPEYKAHRSAMPDELRVQLDHLDEILEAMNIPAIRAEGFEADDALATLSKQVPDGIELFIVTGDQDAMQLVDGRVRVLRTTRGVSETKTYGRQEVIEEYGVTPEQIPDYKALVGDPSDNIPGVRGIGPKGAANLLQEFDSVQGIYDHLDAVAAKGTRKKLEEGRESAFLSLELARMRFDAPVTFDGEALRFEGVSPEILDVLLRRYEFRSLEPRLAELPVVGGGDLPTPERLAVRFSEEPIEPSFEPVAVAPVGDGRWAVAVADDEVRISEGLPDRPLRVHDAKKAGVRGAHFDTFLAAYLIKPGLGSYELDALASERGLAEVEVGVDDPAVREAARRAATIQNLSPRLVEELEEMGLARLFYDIELPLADVLGEMEKFGMPVEARVLEEVGEEIEGRVEELERRIYEDAGVEFNIGSPKQLGEVLFERLSIPPLRKTKTGYSTDARVLQQLAIEHPIAERIIEYRELTKLRGTYIEGLSKLIGEDGRIHTTLNQTAAATGRISSESPNLQNIPVRTPLGVRIRDAFTASPGRRLVVADYSQIELRILAHMTGEPALVESFTKGEDIHTRTAAEVFDTRIEMVTPELRRRAKMVNFGILYGISGFGLASRLGNVHPAEAERYIKRYFERYPKVTEFMKETLQEAEELGYATTLFGRRRYVPELGSSNKNIRRLGERLAFNARVQGSAADIIKVAMVDLAPRLRPLGADMIMQVHDELVFDVDEDRVDVVAGLAADRMVAAYDLEPPLEVEVKTGERWGRVEPLEKRV
ncbi:MAG TPA: DNA polymerase I [Rubrobacteraceae bacterium]|nr:DNA polymerase I [Rubrobacteraceae bacterium]